MLDILFALPTLFIIALFIIAFSYSNNVLTSAFENVTMISNETKAKITVPAKAFFDTFNYGFLAIVVATFILISALAYWSNMHPMFFPISLFVMAIAVFFSFFLANAYWDFVNTSAEFLALANQFWVVTYIMKNLPFIVTAFCFFLAYITYKGKGYQPSQPSGGL